MMLRTAMNFVQQDNGYLNYLKKDTERNALVMPLSFDEGCACLPFMEMLEKAQCRLGKIQYCSK